MKYVLYNISTGNLLSLVDSTKVPVDFDDHAHIQTDLSADALVDYTVVNGTLTRKSDSDIEQQEIERAWVKLRAARNSILDKTDWTQFSDSPADTQLWATYRQQLRDLPYNTTDPRSPVWPTKPE